MVSTWSAVRLEPLMVLFLSLSTWARQNFTGSTGILECSLRQFKCDNGRCVQQVWLCDSEDDCGDGSDETPARCTPAQSCKENEFRCGNGRCIPQSWQCDREQDCQDGSDESDVCAKTECQEEHFECQPGVCIPSSWKCDGQPDCLNGEDEKHCALTCSPEAFTCKNGNCIPQGNVCDLDDDCGDSSDEKNCPMKSCQKNDFQCHDKSCIISKWKCDGDYDCPDGSDEKNCPKEIANSPICLQKEFQCPDKITCVHSSWVCDGENDCPDGADESSSLCVNVTCRHDQFQCNNGFCVADHLRCNGLEDCFDGSDEENCSPASVCQKDEFHCSDDTCIPVGKVCDRNYDCPGGEDEPAGKCGVDECLINNGGCSHLCINDPIGFHCGCHLGYKLVGNFTCVDIDECEILGSCSQICVNERGTFKCDCHDGYEKDPQDGTLCKAKGGATELLFSRRHSIQKINVTNHESTTIVNDTKAATAFDFVFEKELIFWSDSLEKKIFKTPLNDSNERIEVIKEGIVLCDGLAVDWIYGHIYWTDTGKNTIELANYEGGMRKTLIKDSLDEPRSIALNPLEGWMFWSDWGKQGRIERSGLDGSLRQVIVSHEIKWPNGITLDFISRRIFWVDAKLSSISSSNYDGTGRTLVLRSADTLHHPFSISVFEDYVFWSDWDTQAIFRANKFRGSNATAVTEARMLQNPMVVHIFHSYRQPVGINHCSEGKCSHLCLPTPKINAPSLKFICSCPDGFQLSKNGFNCTDENVHEEVQREEYHFQNKSETVEIVYNNTRPGYEEEEVDAIAIIIISGAALFLLTLSLVAIIVCRYYLNGNVTIHFDHPLYHKAAEDESSTESRCPTQSTLREEVNDEEVYVPLNNTGSYDIV